MCKHKNVFPMLPIEYGGIVILSFLLSLGNMAGNGGGGLIVPMAQIFFGFDIKISVGISNAVLFTGSVTRYLYTLK